MSLSYLQDSALEKCLPALQLLSCGSKGVCVDNWKWGVVLQKDSCQALQLSFQSYL